MNTCTPFHLLIDAALAANLSKNEYKLFLALLRQTLGYGKTCDPLTPNRLSRLTGIRKDRLEKAILGLLQTEIFSRKKHAIFMHEYHINADYLPRNDSPLYSPQLPQNRHPTQKTETKPDKWGHTNTTNTSPNQYNNKAETEKTTPESVITANRSRENALVKPQSVDVNTYETLLPALLKLQTPTAQNVLGVLSCAITNHSIKTTPIRLRESRARRTIKWFTATSKTTWYFIRRTCEQFTARAFVERSNGTLK